MCGLEAGCKHNSRLVPQLLEQGQQHKGLACSGAQQLELLKAAWQVVAVVLRTGGHIPAEQQSTAVLEPDSTQRHDHIDTMTT